MEMHFLNLAAKDALMQVDEPVHAAAKCIHLASLKTLLLVIFQTNTSFWTTRAVTYSWLDYTSSIKRNIENLSLIREICVFIGTL